MLNSGILLLRPYASDYSRLRCFYIANQLLSSPSITKAIKSQISEEGFHSAGSNYLQEYAASFQYAALERAGHAYFTSPSALVNKPVKNCPTCSAVGYHCDLYDIPWVRFCPIHGERLLKACPACHKDWMRVGELPGNTCRWCGTHISFDDLAARSAFRRFDYEPIQEVWELICRDAPGEWVFLESGLDTRSHLDHVYPVNQDSEYFPSFLCQDRDSNRNALRRVGASLCGTIGITSQVVPCSIAPNHTSRYEQLQIDEIETQSKTSVSKSIFRLLRKPRPLACAIFNPYRHIGEWESLYEVNSVSQIAYHLWWALANLHRRGCRDRLCSQHLHLFRRAGLTEVPLIPSAKRLIVRTHQHIDDQVDVVFIAPRWVAELLYRLELISFFKRVWCFVSHRYAMSACMSPPEIKDIENQIFRSDEGYLPMQLCLDGDRLSCTFLKIATGLEASRGA